MPPSFDFRGRRLDLANTFREWHTPHEAAIGLGTETGSVFGLIRRMHGEGILEADCDPDPPTRGTQYRLTPPARIALDDLVEERVAAREEVGRLQADQRLLIVKGEALTGLEEVLADPRLSASVAWGSWIGPSWLLAMAPGSTSQALRRLAGAFERAGYSCERGKVDELQAAAMLRKQAASNTEEAKVT